MELVEEEEQILLRSSCTSEVKTKVESESVVNISNSVTGDVKPTPSKHLGDSLNKFHMVTPLKEEANAETPLAAVAPIKFDLENDLNKVKTELVQSKKENILVGEQATELKQEESAADEIKDKGGSLVKPEPEEHDTKPFSITSMAAPLTTCSDDRSGSSKNLLEPPVSVHPEAEATQEPWRKGTRARGR